MLTERVPNETIFYTGGSLVRHAIAEGDRLSLRSGDQNVVVRDIAIIGLDHYAGTIYGFEPSHAIEHNGLRLDQRIEFWDKNIFGVDAV
ncbi:hypothetical protein [Stenotrophomonas sepilia]|uniref:hypothetical protein n=1 Tax=Stenotrophomonas sepilia TaxID=2860290 RepID=UPI002FE6B2A2